MPRLRRQIVGLALIVASLGLIIWLATASATRAGDAYRDRGAPAEALFDGHQLGQVILPPLDELVGIRLWLHAPANPRDSTVALRLRSLEQAKDLAIVELPVVALAADGPTTFSLPALAAPPLQINRRETLELMLTTRGVDQSDPVSVGAGQNGYGYGLMVRDGEQIARSDLAFETLYRARLLDRALPISAIAYGRPGIFGWPPLYALLVYGVLLVLGRFTYRLLRGAFRAQPA